MKVPHLRNQYQKIGMFGIANPGTFDGPFTSTGNQIRGFGFLHDGSVDTNARFHSAKLFSVSAAEQIDLEAFMMVFESDLAPVVGQQVTLTSANPAAWRGRASASSRARPRRASPRSCSAAPSRSAISSPRWSRAASSAATSSTPAVALPARRRRRRHLRHRAAQQGADRRQPRHLHVHPARLRPAHGAGPRRGPPARRRRDQHRRVPRSPAHRQQSGAGGHGRRRLQRRRGGRGGYNPNDPFSNPDFFSPPVPSLGPLGLGAVAGVIGLLSAALRRTPPA